MVIGDYDILQSNSQDNTVRGKSNVLRNNALRDLVVGEINVVMETVSDVDVRAPLRAGDGVALTTPAFRCTATETWSSMAPSKRR